MFIVEGAVLGRKDCDADGHSTDNTISVIEQLVKKHSNVKFVTRDERWKDLEDIKNFLVGLVPNNNWIVVNDADEIYQPTDIAFLRRYAEEHPGLIELLPLFLHFYRDFHHIQRPGADVNITHQRIFFREEGDHYRYHPTILNKYGRDKFFFGPFQPRRKFVKGMYIYHFGLCKGPANYTEKHRWYIENLVDYQQMPKSQIEKIKNHPYVTGLDNPNDILEFDGPYPSLLCSNPLMDYHYEGFKDVKIDNWKSVKEYDGGIVWPGHMQWRVTNGKSGDGHTYIQP